MAELASVNLMPFLLFCGASCMLMNGCSVFFRACFSVGLRYWLILCGAVLLPLNAVYAQTNPHFSVTVNTGPVAPNSATVFPGEPTSLRITLSNLDSNRPITGVTVEDNLPAGMFIAPEANAYTTCHGNTAITALPGGTSVLLQGASLAPNASCELLFSVAVEGSDSWTNTLAPGQITADGGLLNRTPISATLHYEAAQVPVISKTINPGTIAPGQSARLTINITNSDQSVSNLRLRSEEHTSELQSRPHLVCRLLLEKKKKP